MLQVQVSVCWVFTKLKLSFDFGFEEFGISPKACICVFAVALIDDLRAVS